MPKSGSRGTAAPRLKRPVPGPTTFGLPEGTSFQKFLVERDLQHRRCGMTEAWSRGSLYETRYR